MKRTVLALLDFYKRFVSPMTPPSCRFHPTCSTYAKEAITKRGVLNGFGLTVWRVLRCNPFSKGGIDLVP